MNGAQSLISTLVASGVELAAGKAGIALGFATSSKEGALVVLDPATLAVTSQKKLSALRDSQRNAVDCAHPLTITYVVFNYISKFEQRHR